MLPPLMYYPLTWMKGLDFRKALHQNCFIDTPFILLNHNFYLLNLAFWQQNTWPREDEKPHQHLKSFPVPQVASALILFSYIE